MIEMDGINFFKKVIFIITFKRTLYLFPKIKLSFISGALELAFNPMFITHNRLWLTRIIFEGKPALCDRIYRTNPYY